MAITHAGKGLPIRIRSLPSIQELLTPIQELPAVLALLPVRLPQKLLPPLIQVVGCRTPKEMRPSLRIAVVNLPVSHAPTFMAIPLSAHAVYDLPPAACGQRVNGYSAAVNELAFGANCAAAGAYAVVAASGHH